MGSTLKVDNIVGTSGTSAQITLSGDTATLGSGVTFPAGIIDNTAVVQNSTRTAVSASTSTDREMLDIGDYNKLSSGTKLIIQVNVPAFNFNVSGATSIGLKYGSGDTYWGGGYYYTAQGYGGFFVVYLYYSSHTTTGTQAISLRAGSANGASSRPCAVINPNSSDDARFHQAISTAVIYEVV